MELTNLFFALLHGSISSTSTLGVELEAPHLIASKNIEDEDYFEEAPIEEDANREFISSKFDKATNPIAPAGVTLTEFFDYGMVPVETAADGVAVITTSSAQSDDKFKTFYTRHTIPEAMTGGDDARVGDNEEENDAQDTDPEDETNDLSKLAQGRKGS